MYMYVMVPISVAASDVDAELPAGDEEVGEVADVALSDDPDPQRKRQIKDDDDPVDGREVHGGTLLQSPSPARGVCLL
jgi:hypothetical protein